MDAILDFLTHWPTLTVVSVAIFILQLFAIWSAFHALRHVRSSQAVVAWVVGLITLPFFALPLYWIFARHRFEGYREAIRDIGQRHQQSVTAIRRELVTATDIRSTTLCSPIEQVSDVLDTPIAYGNQFELLIDGHAFFDELESQIRSASQYVYVAFYIIRDDEIGSRFADALIERAAVGVKVRLLYDEVGCLRLPNRYLSRLTKAGVDVRAFNTRQGFANRFQINFRNHRKLIVIDGKRAMVGGLNVGNEYIGTASWVTRWRDTAILIQGDAARKIQAVFAGDYYWAARIDLPEADWSVAPDRGERSIETGGVAAVCATGPADMRPRATMMFAAAVGEARERVWIATPYLVPDDSSMVALAMARARGVDVRFLITSVADQWPVYLAGFYYERELGELGIPVYRYNEGMMHQKCVLVDDNLAMIGSTNLDNRSLYLNFELMVAIEDRKFVDQVNRMLEADFSESTLSNASEKPLRPWLSRVGTAIARLFSPVL
ncbi:putative cardiolipin synthase YwiE [Planctomycetes bacterium CA13]|uniref:Cardiolipin synthase n=1 Tax=Novipirellula herctigrandis TaxID=2527986 RepID=A0A5C5Z7L2_9BACT|nr:putative cardiolipin synthase YwiE [Planctomycetes bacterium CA13]